jgi:beta-lactamase regulating signal transducer with metallopeptidase domain
MNTIRLLFAQPWVDRLGWTLLHFLWQGALIAAVFAIARLFARKPGARYALACIALVAMVATPFVTFGIAGSPSVASASPAAPDTDPASPAVLQTYLPALGFWEQIFPWLVASWFAGVIAFSIRLIGGWFAATRLQLTTASPAPPEWERTLERLAQRIGVSRPVRLLLSDSVETPAVVGWLHPAILTPVAAFAGFPAGYLEALLAHELAHIRRHDFLVNILQRTAEALLFYHPALWWVSKQIRIERELCCDDLAVAASGDVLTYARALAELESLRPAHASLAVAANGGSLVKRIQRLLAPSECDSHALPGLGAASVASILIVLGIFAVANAQAPPKPVAEPAISRDAIWVDTVKLGDLSIDRRALGTLTSRTTARVMMAETQVRDVRLGQQSLLDFRNPQGLVSGRVASIDRQVVNGKVALDLEVLGLPESVQAGAELDATIHIETLSNVFYVGRPVSVAANSEGTLFKLDPDSHQAIRVKVQYGRQSVNKIQIRGGLAPGDLVILSDMSGYSNYDRIVVHE